METQDTTHALDSARVDSRAAAKEERRPLGMIWASDISGRSAVTLEVTFRRTLESPIKVKPVKIRCMMRKSIDDDVRKLNSKNSTQFFLDIRIKLMVVLRRLGKSVDVFVF